MEAEIREQEESSLKVGMVTDSGTIDDKSFNQGTWEGIGQAKDRIWNRQINIYNQLVKLKQII